MEVAEKAQAISHSQAHTPEQQPMADASASASSDQQQQDDSSPTPPTLSTQEILRQAMRDEEQKFGPAKGTWLGDEKRRFDKEIQDYRNTAIAITPRPIVNHASNIIGVMQIIADMGMFVSTGTSLFGYTKKGANGEKIAAELNWTSLEDWKKPWNFVWLPFRNLYSDAIGKFFKHFKPSELKQFETYKKFAKDLVDLEGATARDRIDHLGNPKKLVNTWGLRSGFMGIMPMTFGAILPETQQTPEETLHEFMERKEHPVKYVATQVGRALWFLPQTVLQLGAKILHPDQQQGIGKYKHQFVGLGFIGSGIFSMLSGFRQVQGKIPGNQQYIRNFSQVGVGFFTTLAGVLAMMGINAEEGWKGFGYGMIARNVTLPANIVTRYSDMEQGAVPYTFAQAIFQVKNVFALLLGGAEKSKDGNIVNNEKLVNREKHQEEKSRHHIVKEIEEESREQELSSPADQARDDRLPDTRVHRVAAKSVVDPAAQDKLMAVTNN